MNKILLVVKREYLTRVRKKSFIVMTFLTPILFAGLIGALVWISLTEESDQRFIGVIDHSGLGLKRFQDTEGIDFIYLDSDLEEAKANLVNSRRDGLLYIPELDINNPQGVQLYSESNPHFSVTREIENILEKEIEKIKMARSGITEEMLDQLETRIDLDTLSISSEGEKSSDEDATWITAYVSSLLIYFFLFLYGVQVMKGVIEEKYNRIVEVIISSVKPFQLMMGKILGIALVGLTQFLLWVTLSSILLTVAQVVFGFDAAQASPQPAMEGIEPAASSEFWEIFNSIPFAYVITVFVVYFLGGYFLYAALFALVGSAMDSDADSQQFMFPITIPLIISIVALGIVLQDPDGSIAFWMSMIPLSSPVIMLGRIPFGVDTWEILLSVTLLISGFIFTTWVAARIYRVGILMHGSKVSYKTLVKWFFQKN